MTVATKTPAQPIRLYRMGLSGHCHRVELMMSLLGLACDAVDVNLLRHEHKTPEFLALNPLGQVPVIEDGDVLLADSNAILVYLVRTYSPESAWWPAAPVAAAQVQRWFSLAASLLAAGPATARFAGLIGQPIDPHSQALGHRLFAVMEATLANRSWLVGDAPSVADIALYSYSAQAEIGGIALADYPQLRAWLARVEALPGFIPLSKALP